MSEKTVDGFFYGLFMDPNVISRYGIPTRNPRQAYVDNFELLIGNRATLWPSDGARSFGMIYSMTHPELEKLYSGAGLIMYRPEAIVACTLESGMSTACLCYNLTERPGKGETDLEYLEELRLALSRLGFPKEYIEALRS